MSSILNNTISCSYLCLIWRYFLSHKLSSTQDNLFWLWSQKKALEQSLIIVGHHFLILCMKYQIKNFAKQIYFWGGTHFFRNSSTFLGELPHWTGHIEILTKNCKRIVGFFKYCVYAIISPGLYIFTPFFTAVYNQEQFILQTINILNKEILL